MTASITKVTNYEVILNLSQIEFTVFNAIMANLKESEILGALNGVGFGEEMKAQALKAYENLKSVNGSNIKMGS